MAAVSAFAAAKGRLNSHHSPNFTTGTPRAFTDSEDSYTSDEIDGDSPNEFQDAVLPLPRLRLSTWTPAEHDLTVDSEGSLNIRLKHNERVTFTGCYELIVESGAVEVAGAVLCPSSTTHRVYAPTTSALPAITCKTRECSMKLRSCLDGLRSLEQISQSYSRVFHGLAEEAKQASGLSFGYLEWSDELGFPTSPLDIPREWFSSYEKFLQEDLKMRRYRAQVFVCGSQKCGKSTYCRTFINHALTRDALQRLQAEEAEVGKPETPVAATAFLLDLDPGQPELSPPGLISLIQIAAPILGPPFSHPSCYGHKTLRVLRAHAITNNTPQDDVQHFLSCCAELCRRFERKQQEFPGALLVVNTPGWITGQGLQVMTELLNVTKHSATVIMGLNGLQISDEERSEIRHVLHDAAKDPQIVELESQARSGAASRELRTMQYQSYFHLKEPKADRARWSALPLNSGLRLPLSLKYGETTPDIIGLVSLFDIPAETYIAPWINRNIVAVCFVEDAQLADQMSAASTRTANEGLPYLYRPHEAGPCDLVPPDPAKTRCLGLAYVKEVDAEDQSVTLITPVMHLVMSLVSDHYESAESTPRLFLVAGRFETPHWAYAEDSLWDKHNRKRMRDEEFADPRRPYVRRLRQGETGDLVVRVGETGKFARNTGPV